MKPLIKALGMVCWAAAGLAVLGCSNGGGDAAMQWPTWKPPWSADTATPSPGDTSLTANSESYTILLCPPFRGSDHVRNAKAGEKAVKDATGWSGVYLVHEEQDSSLYFGHYLTAKKAGAELLKVRAWKMTNGSLPFSLAIVTRLAGSDIGPRQWDLSGAKDPNWAYTLVIAEFHNVPEEDYLSRKEDAVTYCRNLRGRGQETFFYHGPSKSMVTLGVFPVSAFHTETMPNGMLQDVIESEALRKAMRSFPDLLINGFKAKAKGSRATMEGTYVTAVSDYCPSNHAPLPKTWRYQHPPASR
jgi:hypothetical protein